MQTDYINEFIKIYKSVFGVTNRINTYWKMDKKINYFVILTGIFGVFYIMLSVVWKSSHAYIALILYVASCIVVSIWINSFIKRKYNDVNYLEEQFAADFIDRVNEEMYFDLKSEKERSVIEEYLQFHSDKEKYKKTFVSIFKPGVSWIALIFPVILPMIVSLEEKEIVYFIILLSIYVVVISAFALGFMREINGLTKASMITSILEMINIEKMRSLKQEIMGNRLDGLLSDRDFTRITLELLRKAGYKEANMQNIALYQSALHSIEGNVDREWLRQIIQDTNDVK